MTRDWFDTLHDDLWLRPDEGGEAEAEALRRILGVRKGQRLLDAPCGAGRVAHPLARHGVEVVGIDLRRTFVDRARRRFPKDGVRADLRCMDMRSIDFESEFHAVCSWFNSFGYFADDENADLARRFARALRPGGRLLIDQLNRERILRNFRAADVKHGVRMLSRWDARKGRLTVRRVIAGIPAEQSRSSQRLYTPAQMRGLLTAAGLEVESVFGSLNREPHHRGCDRMIVVARKTRHD